MHRSAGSVRNELTAFLRNRQKRYTGYKGLKCKVRLRGNGTREQYEEVHKTVVATSPNDYNISHAIKLNTELVIE
jgi:hypothetical protein